MSLAVANMTDSMLDGTWRLLVVNGLNSRILLQQGD
jgi:hypothetical protein